MLQSAIRWTLETALTTEDFVDVARRESFLDRFGEILS